MDDDRKNREPHDVLFLYCSEVVSSITSYHGTMYFVALGELRVEEQMTEFQLLTTTTTRRTRSLLSRPTAGLCTPEFVDPIAGSAAHETFRGTIAARARRRVANWRWAVKFLKSSNGELSAHAHVTM